MALFPVNDENFDTEVMYSPLPVLIDFYAVWCGPCKMLAPAVAALAEEYDGKVKVVKIDVDAAPAVAARFGISSIPTLVVMRAGEVTAATVGYRSKEELIALLQKGGAL